MSLYVQWECGFDCAIQTENNMVDRYMANDNFYKLAQVDGRIKDPEQVAILTLSSPYPTNLHLILT